MSAYFSANISIEWHACYLLKFKKLTTLLPSSHNEALHKADQRRGGRDHEARRNTSSDQVGDLRHILI